MSYQLITAVVSIVLGIIGLAALATVLSGQAQTSNVIKSASGGLATDISAATNPYSGGNGGLGSLPSLGSGTGNGI